MILNRANDEESPKEESPDRRRFIRKAVWIGGAAVLLLSSASRKVMALSLELDPKDLEAARRAQQTPGATTASQGSVQQRPPSTQVAQGCDSCAGSCTGCGGSCTSCQGCQGCSGTCVGCTGINL